MEVWHLFCNRSEPSLGVGMELLQSGAAALGVLLQPSQIIYHQIIPNIYCVIYVIMFYGYYVEVNVHGEEKKKNKATFLFYRRQSITVVFAWREVRKLEVLIFSAETQYLN